MNRRNRRTPPNLEDSSSIQSLLSDAPGRLAVEPIRFSLYPLLPSLVKMQDAVRPCESIQPPSVQIRSETVPILYPCSSRLSESHPTMPPYTSYYCEKAESRRFPTAYDAIPALSFLLFHTLSNPSCQPTIVWSHSPHSLAACMTVLLYRSVWRSE